MTVSEETAQKTSEHVLEIQLNDGQCLHAKVAGGRDAAMNELTSFHSRLDVQTFVLVGDTIVRSQEIRSIQLREDDDSGGGIIDAVRSRLGGESNMSNYETQQQTRQHGHDGPGFAEQWVGYGRRPWAETKPFFMTSEFLFAALMTAGILIATWTLDNLDAQRGWLYAAIVGSAYILSRGFAKSGTRDPNPDRHAPLGRNN